MSFDVAGPGPVLLSLPAWTPGAYELTCFARWVADFTADGRRTGRWRGTSSTTTPGASSPPAPSRSASGSTTWPTRSTTRWPGPGRTSCCSTAPTSCSIPRAAASISRRRSTIKTEPDVARRHRHAERAAAGAARTAKANYHDLVDMPFFVGRFDYDSMQVAGAWTRLATYPAGALTGPGAGEAVGRDRQGDPAGGGGVRGDAVARLHGHDDLRLELRRAAARSSTPTRTSASTTRRLIGSPILTSITAHEIFHAWNVKRLRPADMVPYRYDRTEPTLALGERGDHRLLRRPGAAPRRGRHRRAVPRRRRRTRSPRSRRRRPRRSRTRRSPPGSTRPTAASTSTIRRARWPASCSTS